MAPLQASLNRAFSCMAAGSQRDAVTVHAAAKEVLLACNSFQTRIATRLAEQPAALATQQWLPRMRDLLQAAGWLYPCFMPSRSLAPDVQRKAWLAWQRCMALSALAVARHSVLEEEALRLLAEPRSHPQIPGALIWLDRLAAQLTPEVVQQLAAAGFDDVVSMSLTVWDELLQSCGNPDVSPWSAVALLLPGLLNLARRVALLPADTSAPAGLDSCDQGRACEQLAYVMQIYGRVLAYAWTQWPGVDPRAAQHGTALTSPGQTARRLWSAEQIAALWSAEQIAALQSCQDIWWGGVASLASSIRAGTSSSSSSGGGHGGGSSGGSSGSSGGSSGSSRHAALAASTTSRASSSSSRSISSTSNSHGHDTNPAAALCPSYHVWWQPVCFDKKVKDLSKDLAERYSRECLELLLMQESLGPLPWALQQLAPFRAAQQEGGSSATSTVAGLYIQWPMLMGTLGSSSDRTCSCGGHTCHLCTPPPPVTLQQLRLVLEVVCLTCQDPHTPQGQQAQLLLVLLLRRAAPGMRASFFNSADGTRLLVALQQAEVHEPIREIVLNSWCRTMLYGALSLPLKSGGVDHRAYIDAPLSQAVHTLAWCFLDAGCPGNTAAAVGVAGGGGGGGAGGATTGGGADLEQLPMSVAVAQGAVLQCKMRYHTSCLHLLRVPATSLRLAAGVQPSLALFATLEGLLRQPYLLTVSMLYGTLLGAVRALLEPAAPDGQSEQASVGTATSSAAASSTDTDPTTSSTSSSSSSGGGSSSSMLSLELLEAVCSAAITAGKAMSTPWPSAEWTSRADGGLEVELYTIREVMVLGAQLSNAVLQLALQQLQRHQQQPPQLQGRSKAMLQLMQAASSLLQYAAAAAATDAEQQLSEAMGDTATFSFLQATMVVPVRGMTAEDRRASTRLLFLHLRTASLRLTALGEAAAAVAAAVGRQQQGVLGSEVAATGAEPGACTGGTAPAAAGSCRCSCGSPQCAVQPWCPAHSSSIAPAAEQQGSGMLEHQLVYWITDPDTMFDDIPAILQCSLPLGCGYDKCDNLDGPSEAGLVANGRGVLCSGCGVVRFCSPECARKAWPDHRWVCERLAAALGRCPAAGSTSSNSASSNMQGVGGCAAVGGSSGSLQAPAGEEDAALGASSSSSSSGGTRLTKEQESPGCEGRVCAWCGVASQQLRRCAGCKAVWYCGADHQRAAWKAGHKQECGGGGSAASKS